MDKSIYSVLKKILITLLLLNAAVIFIILHLAFSNYNSQRNSLIEMGYTILRAFEASRPMIFSTGRNEHLTTLLNEMFDLDTINNIVIYRENGDVIFSLHNQNNLIKTDIDDRFRYETKSEMILYNSFHPLRGFTERHSNGNKNSFNSNGYKKNNKIFIAIAINKDNLITIRNYGIATFIAALLVELMIFQLSQILLNIKH